MVCECVSGRPVPHHGHSMTEVLCIFMAVLVVLGLRMGGLMKALCVCVNVCVCARACVCV